MKNCRCFTSAVAIATIAVMASGFASNMLKYSSEDLLASLGSTHNSEFVIAVDAKLSEVS